MRRRAGRAWVAALALAALCAPAAAGAQEPGAPFEILPVERLYLDDVVPAPDGERDVELYLRAETRLGEPVENLRPSDLAVVDEGDRIDEDDLGLQLLSETDRGMACVLAIDVSRTMRGEPFERARAAALSFLDRLGSFDRVAIVTFASEVNVPASFASAHSQARVELEGLQVDEESLSTRLYDGVYKAVELIREAQSIPRRRFVIVFSDGKDGGSGHTLEEIIEYSRGDEVRPRTLVFTIGYARFGGGGLDSLRHLARETGASDFRATSTIDLASFFNEVWRQMKQSYVVRYPGSMDGRRHTVEVCVEGQCDTRSAAYPYVRGPLWPWFAGGGVAVVALAAMLLLRRRDSMGRLVFRGGPRDGEVVALRGSRVRIGALADNEIVIASGHASRYHARIVRHGRDVEIEDLNSSNGTFVNGMRVRTSPLRSGDKIRVADVDMVYER